MTTAENGFSSHPNGVEPLRTDIRGRWLPHTVSRRESSLPKVSPLTRNRKFKRCLGSCTFGLPALMVLVLTARVAQAAENAAPVASAASPAPADRTQPAAAPVATPAAADSMVPAAAPAATDTATATAPAAAPAAATTPATEPATATAPAATTPVDEEAPSDDAYLPGSPKPYGLGLDPEAPNAGPAPGGRAPSFGTSTAKDDWSFRLGGRIAAFEVVGVGEKPAVPPVGYKGTPLHMPPLIQGRQPFWPGAGLSLFMQYGNPMVQATVNYFASMAGQELRGFYNPFLGPTASQAFLTFTPPAFGATRFQAKVGSFTEIYGGVGEWGWGLFGPLLGIRGYGEVIAVEHDLSPSTTLWFSHGINAVPQVPESLPRGDYVPWVEQGMSSFVNHAHVGLSYKSNYKLRLHFAQVNGTDEQTYMAGNDSMPKRDGRIRVLALESHTLLDPFGHIGVAASFYDFKRALSVNDGLWWGLDWTQGGREQVNKFLGTGNSGDGGTGKVLALSAQWDFSAARIMWHPRSFDGRSPDIKAHIAAIKYFTLDAEPATLLNPACGSESPGVPTASGQYCGIQSVDTHNSYKGKGGYLIATEVQYSMLSWMSLWLRAYGESRYQPPSRKLIVTDVFGLRTIQNDQYVLGSESLGPWRVYSLTPSVHFRSDWFSLDGIEIAYSRRFYSKAVDSNPNQPLDRNVVTIGAYSSF